MVLPLSLYGISVYVDRGCDLETGIHESLRQAAGS